MRRDPSLHITKSNLARILAEVEFNARTNPMSLADAIMTASIPYQIKDRYLQLLEQNKVTKDKITRSIKADQTTSDQDVGKMNLILHTLRMASNPHVKPKPILRDSKDYLMLKDITKLAIIFCETFGIENKNEGFKEYLTIGLSLMRNYSLNRFKYYDNRIHEDLNARVTLAHDPDKEGTESFKEMLVEAMRYYSSMEFFIKKDEHHSLLHVYHGRVHADEVGAEHDDWIIAQFEGLAFLDTLPELSQFYGENALGRYKKYMVNKVKTTEESESITEKYEDHEED